eukprot:30088-Chlamydomonas_euryale.AAC.1
MPFIPLRPHGMPRGAPRASGLRAVRRAQPSCYRSHLSYRHDVDAHVIHIIHTAHTVHPAAIAPDSPIARFCAQYTRPMLY